MDSPSAPNEAVREPWIRSERKRSTVTVVTTIVGTTLIETLWLMREPHMYRHAGAIAAVVAWTLFPLGHALLTWLAHRKLSERELRRLLAPVGEVHTRGIGARARLATVRWHLWDRWLNEEAPSWSAQISVLALILVAMMLVTPELRESQPLLLGALTAVAASWINVAVTYALHYAKLDLHRPGLDFPGTEERSFLSYVYVALALQATFGTTDVTVTTDRMRRAVMMQTALAFVFNTVIIALVVSLLLGATA